MVPGIHNLQKLLRFGSGGSLRKRLVYGSIGSFGVKTAASAVSLIATIVLARHLGVEHFGVYSYIFGLTTLVAIPIQLGLPDLVVRETAKSTAKGELGLLLSLWRWANTSVIAFSIAVGTLMSLVAHYMPHVSSSWNASVFYWAILLVPLMSLTKLRESSMRGLGHVVIGQISDSVVRPALLIMFVLIAGWIWPNSMDAVRAMRIHVIASCLALGLSAFLLSRLWPRDLERGSRSSYRSRQWIVSALPLAFIAGMGVINNQADIVMLGIFQTPEQVGSYKVAIQGAMLVSFGLSAMAMATMPYFARFHELGEMRKFQMLATYGARFMFSISLPAAIVFIAFGRQIIGFVFGEEYVGAYFPLVILSSVHVIHAGFGIIGPLLVMTGHERTAAKGIALAALMNVVLNLWLIPKFGMIGAACATASSLVFWNVILWVAVRHKLGIDSSAVGLPMKIL